MAQSKYHFDALERQDSQLNSFFARQLEQIRPQLYEVQYPAFKARRWLPIKNDINLGADSYTVRAIAEAGEAAFMQDQSNNRPQVELTGATEDNWKMRGMSVTYGWDLQEARAAQFAGLDLSMRKPRAARRAIEKLIDKSLLIGATVYGVAMQGLFSLAGGQAPVTTTPSTLAWDTASADEIYAALMGMVSKIYIDSNEVEVPDTMIVPTSIKQLLMNRRMGDANNMSILKYFLETNEMVKTLDSSLYLESNGGHSGGAVRRIVTFTKDPDLLEGLVNEFEQLPPQFDGSKVSTICLARVGGVATHRPKSIGYGDGV